MTRPTLARTHTLTSEQQKNIRQLVHEHQADQRFNYKLDPSTLESQDQPNITHFLLTKYEELKAYLLTNFFNTTELELTMVAADKKVFKQFLDLARAEAEVNKLNKLLLAIDTNDHVMSQFAKDATMTYDFSEYRLELTHHKAPTPSDSSLKLRPATDTDKDLIDQLDVEGFGSHDNCKLTDIPFIKIAEVAGEPVGKIRLEETETTVGIFGFVVSQHVRGKGYGSEILAQVIQEKLAAGLDSIFLEVALENPAALKLYERSGFEKTATFDYYQLLLS